MIKVQFCKTRDAARALAKEVHGKIVDNKGDITAESRWSVHFNVQDTKAQVLMDIAEANNLPVVDLAGIDVQIPENVQGLPVLPESQEVQQSQEVPDASAVLQRLKASVAAGRKALNLVSYSPKRTEKLQGLKGRMVNCTVKRSMQLTA